MRFYLIPIAAIGLSACTQLQPHDAPQAAYEVESSLVAALKAANAYAALPKCPPGAALTVCSSPPVVTTIDLAAHKASIAVLTLEAIAKDTKADATDLSKAQLAAQAAVDTLTKLIPPAPIVSPAAK